MMIENVVTCGAILGLLLLVGQGVWTQHQNEKRNAYQRLFLAYVAEFMGEVKNGDGGWGSRSYMQECVRLEQLCVAAQELASQETFIWPWRWIDRWGVDYLKEAQRKHA